MIIGHNSNISTTFYNDRIKEIMDAGIMAEPFTFIPILAGHMELVGGNAMVFGKITEGYDAITPDIAVEISYEDLGSIIPSTSLSVKYQQVRATEITYPTVTNFNIGTLYHMGDIVRFNGDFYKDNTSIPLIGVFPGGILGLLWYKIHTSQIVLIPSNRIIYGVAVVIIPQIIIVGATYIITVVNIVEDIDVTASYTAVEGDTYVQVRAGLIADLPAGEIETGLFVADRIFFYGRNKSFTETPVREDGDVNTVYKDFAIDAYILSEGLSAKFPQLKCGAVQPFGLVYKDRAGRTNSVVKTDAMDVYIPYYTEAISGGGNTPNSIIKLIFKIYHKPPAWAESYEIVYFGNVSMDYFLQLRAYDITHLNDSSGNRYSINIYNTLLGTWEKNNRWRVPPYVWEDGDRLRLAGVVDEGTQYYGETIGGNFVYDYEIEAVGTQYNEEVIGGDWLIVQAVNHPNPFAGATNIIVEVYRPKKGISQTVAYGTGMVFEILTDANGNRYHDGDVPQVFNEAGVCTTPASVNNFTSEGYSKAYDCWKFLRLNYVQSGLILTGLIRPFWAESIFPSDWWRDQDINRKLTSMGFPFLEDVSQRQVVLHERIRHGGFLIAGTRTNNIAHFTFADFMDFPQKNGDITGLREVGYTLKVIQMYKETSVYINRIQTFNPDGTEQFALTDKFLAEQRPMETDYGCQHPDSIMVNGRYVYYWDNAEGAFIRSAANGQTVLDIKMKRWFKDLLKWIQASGGGKALQVRTGANNEHDEVWLTLIMTKPVSGVSDIPVAPEVRGIIFSEKRGRFISRINQITETYVHLGNFFAHLYQQSLWIMNLDEGQDWLTWVGVPTYAEIEVVSNIEPVRNKIYNAVALFADHEMDSLPKYVYIPQEASAGNEIMESNIPIWERREGVFFGEILRDENSKGNYVSLYDRKMNGQSLRGRFCFVKLYTDEHDEKVRVDSIVIMSTPSARNV